MNTYNCRRSADGTSIACSVATADTARPAQSRPLLAILTACGWDVRRLTPAELARWERCTMAELAHFA